MSGFSIRFEGLEKLNLLKIAQEKLDEIDTEVEGTLYDIQAKAKNRVPFGAGGSALAGSITVLKDAPMKGEVVVQKFYAPYVNFGTGLFASQFLATQDQEWTDYARQFYVNGKGRIPATPFFTSAVNEERIKLIERVKEILLK